MSATVGSQRLISVSLGKIAQSRGQRGGINLHKNLLVATVLHKARAAYMMETYNFHHQQTLHRQKSQEQEQSQQQQMEYQQQQEMCESELHDYEIASNVFGQTASATPAVIEEIGSCPSASGPPSTTQVSIVCHVGDQCEFMCAQESEVRVLDKENNPPVDISNGFDLVTENHTSESNEKVSVSSSDHLQAANQLARDALASEKDSYKLQQTSGSPTCNGILKRRKDNPRACAPDNDCPAAKKARVVSSGDTSVLSQSKSSVPPPCQLTALNSVDYYSSDDSDCESDLEVAMIQTSDSPQITNLVSIFNSGFSGLCASSEQDNNSHFTSLANLRPESPTPSSFSRKMSEPSLQCSAEVGRLGSQPSAIVLWA